MTLDDINNQLDEVLGQFETDLEAALRTYGQGLRGMLNEAAKGEHRNGAVGALVLHRIKESESLLNTMATNVLHEELYK